MLADPWLIAMRVKPTITAVISDAERLLDEQPILATQE
jgi:hypothetical protein